MKATGFHRWTAEALRKHLGEEAYREACRRAGMYLDWHVRNESKDLGDLVEAVRLLLRGRAFDEAAEAGEAHSQLSNGLRARR